LAIFKILESCQLLLQLEVLPWQLTRQCLVCCCAKEKIEVSFANGEIALWPKQVALVGYPIYKHFEAQKIKTTIGECFFAFKLKALWIIELNN
jgi:hypothetical protein